MFRTRSTGLLLSIALLVAVAPAAATAQNQPPPTPPIEIVHPELGDKTLPLSGRVRHSARVASSARYEVGDKRFWLALDVVEGIVYPKRFKLRGMGDHIEVWVATGSDEISSGIKFPEGDCRNGPRTRITDRQVRRMIRAFDGKIFPRESAALSRPPRRNGEDALFPDLVGLPQNTYRGQGDNIVTLVDNVRDEHFYDPGQGYIAGFFQGGFNEYFDRNVMTIDAFDWLHRTGANPPDDPVPGDICRSASASPFLYESVFAHEYQHLLMYYEDTNETSWVDEGLANWAARISGFTDPRIPITDTRFDQHVWGFLGFLGIETPANPNPYPLGGPENALTVWGDQGDPEILADYGAASTMMEFLDSRYGGDFIKRLHREDAPGLEGLAKALIGETSPKDPRQLIHDWNAAVALDAVLSDGAVLTGGNASDYQVEFLDASINWDTEHAYSEPGAPPNGADYVRLRDADGDYLSAGEIQSITFDGIDVFEPTPLEWRSVSNAPGRTGQPVLHSGSGPDMDRTMVREVTVPATNATLTFESAYEIEEFWDFGFVQVSTDGGETWTSLANANTTNSADPGAQDLAVQNLPGFTGTSGCARGSQADCPTPEWETQTFDLTPYAGQEILISFRLITDPEVDLGGWWIDDVAVGGAVISEGDVTGWQSAQETNPVEIEGFTVQLVAYNDAHTAAWLAQLPLGAGFEGSITGTDIAAAIGTEAETVGALITYDESTEMIDDYAGYTLTVNDVVQPGG